MYLPGLSWNVAFPCLDSATKSRFPLVLGNAEKIRQIMPCVNISPFGDSLATRFNVLVELLKMSVSIMSVLGA